MAGNANLHAASKAKNDEFYTQLSDIEKELMHYRGHFRGKTVFCNCDDPYESNFFKYFALNFNQLGLRKLIATCHNGSPVSGNELLLDFGDTANDPHKIAYKVEINEVSDMNGDGAIDLSDVRQLLQNNRNIISILRENGDFRSTECIDLLRQADIVVTNPPFSLFREYVAQLIEYGKQFLIIGNKNAITYKEIFPLIKDNKLWIGATPMSADLLFDIPKERAEVLLAERKQGSSYKIVNGKVKGRAQAIWFTNIDIQKRHEELVLYKHYTPEEYPKYDNYDAINVDKVTDIPCDYDGVMGVPITFLDKYNSAQFEIIGATESEGKGFSCGLWDENSKIAQATINGQRVYKRVFIRRKQ